MQIKNCSKSIFLSFMFLCCVASFAVPTDGLVAGYLFSGTAQDMSGNDFHGTVYNATLTSDRNGNASSAYYFDGSGDYIEASVSNFNYTNITLAAWIKIDSYSLYGGIVDGFQNKWEFTLSYPGGNKLEFVQWTNSGYDEYYSNSTLSTDVWYHVAVSIQGTSGTFYLNGVENGSFTLSSSILTDPGSLVIGASNSGSPQYFKGAIDDVYIYNRSLSGSEIQLIYNNVPEPASILLIGLIGIAFYLKKIRI